MTALPGGRVSEETPVSLADGSEHSLDPRSITVHRISRSIGGAFLAIPNLIALVIFGFVGPLGPLGMLGLFGAWVLLCVLLAAAAIWWPPLAYRHTSYKLCDRDMVIRRGVIWRSVHSLPRNRVQHTDVSQGPIDRAFELATLTIYTAGTEHASVELAGLEHGVATRIRDYLIEGGAGDAV